MKDERRMKWEKEERTQRRGRKSEREKSKVKCKGNVKGNNKPNELKETIRGKRTKKITIDGTVKRKGKGRDQKKKGRKREKKVTNGHGKGIELRVKEDKLEKRKDEVINNS